VFNHYDWQFVPLLSTLILFLVIAIGVSFLCSLWESVLLSVTPTYTKLQQEQNTGVGNKLAQFKLNVDRPLAAILTLNTIAHTIGAIGVGEQAVKIWRDTNPLITGVVVPVGMTLAILLLSEIIPKTLGANYWKKFTAFTVHSLSMLIIVLWPAVWLSELITRMMRNDHDGKGISRSEFVALTEISAREGVIDEQESHLIKNIMKFSGIQVQHIMTPRPVVQSVSQTMSIDQFLKQHSELKFSRIPVFEADNKDKITGYVRRDELLMALFNQAGDRSLASIKRDMPAVLANFPIPILLDQFLEKREHMALVVDEYGSMLGIATMEDAIETLLGLEIVDEHDSVEDMQKLARSQWEKRALSLGLLQQENKKEL